MNLKELTRPLDISDIDFRVQSINNGGYATILAYKDARVDMARLDAAVGPLGWQRKHEFINGKLFCHVGLWNDACGEWTWKSDVGTESMTEAAKGESSDSFKRACFNWGIGRELYDYPLISVKLNDNEWTKDGGRPKQTYNLKIRDWTWYSEFTDGRISFIAAKDENGKVRFKWGQMKPKEVEPEFKPAAAPVEVQEDVQAVQPDVQPASVQVADEANVKGILKPQADESDPERDALVAEYNQLYGKNPDKRMKNETIKKAIQDKVDEILDEGLTEEEVEEENISDYFDMVKTITDPKQFIQWAKDTVAKFPDAPQDHVDMFKELCNAHYKSIM
jgi:hypothetical protein